MGVLASCALCGCVITDDGCCTVVEVLYNEGGLQVHVTLGRPVDLPLDEDDATYIMVTCPCPCRGELTRVGDYWQYPGHDTDEGCLIRIHVLTGEVECSPQDG